MNNLVYLNNDPILNELNSSVDKKSAKKMIAFKYFSGNKELLDRYLKENHSKLTDNLFDNNFIEVKSQLEFSF